MRRILSIGIGITLLLGIFVGGLTMVSVPGEEAQATDIHGSPAQSGVPSTKKHQRPAPLAAAVALQEAADEGTEEPLFLPVVDQKDISDHHKALATITLRALPAGCRDRLKTFDVMYKGATRRGLGGKTTIILDGTVNDTEFIALLTHECAHVIHANLLGTGNAPQSMFRDGNEIFYEDSAAVAFWKISWVKQNVKRDDARDADFISGYAKSDAFEDFAETFAAYVLQRDMLRTRAENNAALAAKLQWMEFNLPLAEGVLGSGTATLDGVPWDVTRVPFAV